jgi:hypothetical protein
MAGRAMPKLRLSMVGFGSITVCVGKKKGTGGGFSPTSHHFISSVIRGMHHTRPASTTAAFDDDDAGIKFLYFADATQAYTK